MRQGYDQTSTPRRWNMMRSAGTWSRSSRHRMRSTERGRRNHARELDKSSVRVVLAHDGTGNDQTILTRR